MSLVNELFSGIEKSLLGLIPDIIVDNIGKGSSNDVMPGDVEIKNITLISQDGQRKYNLIGQAISFDVYESIMSPVIFGELIIADSIGLQQSFPIIGEEYVLLEFATPKSKETSRYLFRTDDVRNKKVSENNKKVTYTIPLYSAELIKNASRLVSRPYENTPSALIKEIMSEYIGTEKPVNIEDTTGVEKGKITRMQPFKAIDFLRYRSTSARYVSSSFVFFENRKGYHFVSIERMLNEGGKVAGFGTDKEFFFDTSRKDNVKDVTMRNIIAYNQMSGGSPLAKIQTGGLTAVQQAYDYVSGGLQRVTYTDNVGGDKFKFGVDNAAGQNSTDFVRLHGKTTAVTNIRPVSADKPANTLTEAMVARRAFATKISQNITQIHIYGDTELTVGDVIKCNFPAAIDAENNKGWSRLDSGNYLISKLRHTVLIGDRPQHSISLELIRGFMSETI